METTAPATSRTVIVVADDLIWSSRLTTAVQRAGATPQALRSADELGRDLADTAVIVDLGGRAFDGIDVVQIAAGRGATVLAVAQHDDLELRKRALAAGARRVLSYNKLFNDGPDVVAKLLAGTL